MAVRRTVTGFRPLIRLGKDYVNVNVMLKCQHVKTKQRKMSYFSNN